MFTAEAVASVAVAAEGSEMPGKGRFLEDQKNSAWKSTITPNGNLQVTNVADSSVVLATQPISLGDTPSIDAFARMRTSDPTGLFESTQTYDSQPLLWNTATTGTGSAVYLPNESASALTVAADGDKVIRQTRQYFRYQPGKSQLVMMTYNCGTELPEVRRRVGYFDADNGIFLEEINGKLWIVKRSFTSGSAVDTRIPQTSWNLDTFSELDPSKAQILVMDMEWLGVGRVRVGFVIDGLIRYAHEFLNANNVTTVYMSTAQLPCRYEIEAIDTIVESHNLKQICSTVISEGGQEENIGFPFAASRSAVVAVGGARVPIFSIRPKATFNSKTNRVQVIHRQLETLLTGNNGVVLVEVIYDGTLTGAAFNSVSAQSVIEYDVAATAIAGGTVVRNFYATSSNILKSTDDVTILGRLPISLDIAGANPTPLTIAMSLISGTASGAAGMNWQEYR